MNNLLRDCNLYLTIVSAMTASITEEKNLLQALQLGDHRAFEQLYNRYSKKIYWKLLQMVKDKTEAEEILQELFIKVWNRREQIDLDRSFGAYLYSVAKSMVADYYRRLVRLGEAEKELKLSHTEYTAVTEETILSNETSKLLENAIAQLPVQRQRAFILCKIEGKSHNEAAAIMGISPNTVHNHLVKATQSLKGSLAVENLTLNPGVLVLALSVIPWELYCH
ncbi:RNA polymerase sigma factor [Chryseobacterium sp. SIMBA_029]|uniref:RNA polymerase sigma factor n=1 Tax=Chryseobacterium sp. SIMBA_029 TaxID=3085772 RepID=UPI00397848C3